jgi:uncharacterized protein (DUF1800 family)
MAQWNERMVAHLLRRAGFSGTQEEIKFYLDMGQRNAVETLLNYETIDDSEVDRQVEKARLNLDRPDGLIQWWLLRMIFTKRPLQEKMVLFWHGHFATAISKVKEESYMLKQNQLFRRLALGNFEEFLLEVSKDAAMIIWLDNFTNKKGRPNENYARELMELFSMGVGNYTEMDVKESARAFTGWSIRRFNGEFFFDSNQHDFGQKTFLGETGPLNGDDIVRIIAKQSATSRFITKKLFEFFAYPNPETAVIDRLANIYLSSNFSIKAVMREILNSDEFYSEQAINGLIKSPTELVIGAVRQLKAQTVDFTRDLLGTLNLQGQTLFNPPSVKGWDGGLDWINSSSILTRYNFANSLATNRNTRGTIVDPKALMNGKDFKKNMQVTNFFLTLLGLYDVDAATVKTLNTYLKQMDSGMNGAFKLDDATIDKKVRGLIHIIMSLPDFQLN